MVHKLKQSQWKEIQELLKDPDCNITEIAKQYDISRHAIYVKAWNHGWIIKKKDMPKKKKGLIERVFGK